MNKVSFEELKSSVKEGGKMLRISDERLEELIVMYEWYVSNVDVRTAEFKEFEATLSTLKELQQLRKKEDGYALLLKSTNYDLKRQTEYSDKLAEQNKLLIEDGERLAVFAKEMFSYLTEDDEEWDADFQLALDQHKELMERIEAKV